MIIKLNDIMKIKYSYIKYIYIFIYNIKNVTLYSYFRIKNKLKIFKLYIYLLKLIMY